MNKELLEGCDQNDFLSDNNQLDQNLDDDILARKMENENSNEQSYSDEP